ncbi:MAG: hypothetical protein U5S82_24635 [Gammaproteobacteria bacterium]|nr:hypothetical protein [Gammaproteobacteria bacterium]
MARRNGYRVVLGGIGEEDPEFGPPTQTAYFTRLDCPASLSSASEFLHQPTPASIAA